MRDVAWVIGLLAAATVILSTARKVREKWWIAGVLAGVSALWAWLSSSPEGPQEATAPSQHRGLSSTSGSCRACHPKEYASWHQSFHRTMTARAVGDAIAAPQGEHAVEVDGGVLRIAHRDGEMKTKFLAAGSESAEDPPWRDVVLTTGSHHYQAYWNVDVSSGALEIVPVVWHLEANRWVPRRDVFLQPPSAPQHQVRWNSNCFACHSTLGEPRHDEDSNRFSTSTVELGIACEACHGEGALHVSHFSDPVLRLRAQSDEAQKTFMVNPAELDAERSSELCGQCHSYAIPNDEEAFWETGYAKAYRPGEPLEESRTVITPSWLRAEGRGRLEADVESLFWADGTIRVGGREFNGLSSSACFLRGEGEAKLGCLSCHSLHDGGRVDQLRDEASGDEICLSCHEENRGQAHSGHDESVLCYDCHMPRIAYALYGAQRSHRVDSPSVEVALDTGRPPACNLCHVDKDLAWTQSAMAKRAGKPGIEVEPSDVPHAVSLALTGDAASRVVIADHLLRPASISASGESFQALVLAELLADPYAAVRFIAGRRLKEAGYLRDYDFLGEPSEWARAQVEVRARWAESLPPDVGSGDRRAPLGYDAESLRALSHLRDERPITIAE